MALKAFMKSSKYEPTKIEAMIPKNAASGKIKDNIKGINP